MELSGLQLAGPYGGMLCWCIRPQIRYLKCVPVNRRSQPLHSSGSNCDHENKEIRLFQLVVTRGTAVSHGRNVGS